MEECPICYIEVADNAFKVLECSHSLCKLCFSKLRSHVCPFCRNPIGKKKKKKKTRNRIVPEPIINEREIALIENTYVEEIIPPLNSIRRTRRRTRRRRAPRNRVSFDVPVIMSESEIRNIISSLGYNNTNEVIFERNRSVSDKKKQMCRKKRNRWKEDIVRRKTGSKNKR